MARGNAKMQPLIAMQDRETAVIRDLEEKLKDAKLRLRTIQEAIANMRGQSAIAELERELGISTPRVKNTKKIVLDIINDAGNDGVTASEVVEKATAKGKSLKIASVSSLLSKLKSDGTLTFNGERYFQKLGPEVDAPPKVFKIV